METKTYIYIGGGLVGSFIIYKMLQGKKAARSNSSGDVSGFANPAMIFSPSGGPGAIPGGDMAFPEMPFGEETSLADTIASMVASSAEVAAQQTTSTVMSDVIAALAQGGQTFSGVVVAPTSGGGTSVTVTPPPSTPSGGATSGGSPAPATTYQAPTNVNTLYQALLGRDAEQAGGTGWTQHFGTNVDEYEARQFAAGAMQELTERAVAAKPQSVADLYRTVLGREPEAEGLHYWQAQFGSNISAEEAATFVRGAQKELEQKAVATTRR